MRRVPLIVAAVAALLAAVGLGAFATSAASAATPTKTVTITGSHCAHGSEFCFKSAALLVHPSTKVVWKNATGTIHTVTRCNVTNCGVNGGTGKDPKLSSPTIKPGHTFVFVFHHRGTYRYFCKIHGYAVMHGTITVR